MSPLTWQVIAFLILVNALYVAAEFGLVGVRKNKIELLAEEGNGFARRLLPLLEPNERDRAIAACQIGISLSSLILGAFGQATLTIALTPRLEAWLGLEPRTAVSIAAVTTLLLLTILQMVLGEQVPKAIALRSPVKTALYTVLPLAWSMRVYSLFIDLLNGLGLALLKLIKVERADYRHVHSANEIELLLAESRKEGLIEPEEHVRLRRALHLERRSAQQLMIPLEEVVSVDVAAKIDEILAVAARSPYTRLPVYQGTRERFIGLLHVKDLVAHRLEYGSIRSLKAVLRPMIRVRATLSADDLLNFLREKKSHLAAVADDQDKVIGLITLEDVLAEVLGDIGDEFKSSVEAAPERTEDGRVRLPGSYPLEEAETWVGVPWRGKAKTVGPFIAEHLEGRFAPGDRVTIDGVEVEVERVFRHRIASVLVLLPQEPGVDGA